MIRFFSAAFTGNKKDRPLANEHLGILLSALVRVNLATLRKNPQLPDLYKSGVRFQVERPGEEDWCDIPTVIKRGFADCEDLACWRAAELRVRGVEYPDMPGRRFLVPDAKPFFYWRRVHPTKTLYHIQVIYTDPRSGQRLIEDPSRMLGMGSNAPEFGH